MNMTQEIKLLSVFSHCWITGKTSWSTNCSRNHSLKIWRLQVISPICSMLRNIDIKIKILRVCIGGGGYAMEAWDNFWDHMHYLCCHCLYTPIIRIQISLNWNSKPFLCTRNAWWWLEHRVWPILSTMQMYVQKLLLKGPNHNLERNDW